VPLCKGGPAAFVGVSHGGDANTRIARGKVGIQLPAVAGAYDHDRDLVGHVVLSGLSWFAQVGVGRSSFMAGLSAGSSMMMQDRCGIMSSVELMTTRLHLADFEHGDHQAVHTFATVLLATCSMRG
jgi:hypothetical protein